MRKFKFNLLGSRSPEVPGLSDKGKRPDNEEGWISKVGVHQRAALKLSTHEPSNIFGLLWFLSFGMWVSGWGLRILGFGH